MKEQLVLDTNDVKKALEEHFAKEKGWWRAKATITVYGPSQDGPMHSPGGVRVEVERVPQPESDDFH